MERRTGFAYCIGRLSVIEVIATHGLSLAARIEARKPMIPDNGTGPAIQVNFPLFHAANG